VFARDRYSDGGAATLNANYGRLLALRLLIGSHRQGASRVNGDDKERGRQNSQVLPLLVFVGIVLIFLPTWRDAIAGGGEEQVCDVSADYALGVEDYAEAIRLHREIVRKNPNNALAHYHLGFAEGMIGNTAAEFEEYLRAEVLGLRQWDLFLNMGLAQLEQGDLDAATHSLRKAVLLGKKHPEAHFNLALVDERRGRLAEAEHETLAALELCPEQADARDLLGVIYAEEGKTVCASQTWRALLRDVPDYAPARANLLILESRNIPSLGKRAAVKLPSQAAAVQAGDDDSSPSWAGGEKNESPRPK
jgi:Flp pilus assembly protein TadD